jgi:radical SAM superfamily enzyme YgiQ (UPF0313 family)
MAKCLVINSPLFREKNPLYDEDSLPPIGLGYIATILKQNGVEVELVDAVADNIPLKDLSRLIEASIPDYVCTNIFTTNYSLVKELFATCRYNGKIIIGGLSTKTLYDEIFEWKITNDVDIVAGDGEYILFDLITGAVKQAPTATNGSKRYYLVDKCSPYFVHDISNVPLDRTFFRNEPVQHLFGFREANIVTSRGCIYNCAFCAAATSFNKEFAIREKSEQSIRDEIAQLRALYPGLQSIRVLDDLFLKTKHSLQKATRVFKDSHIQWRSMAHVMTFKDVEQSMIDELKSAGCSEVFIGIESGSPKVLRGIHKTGDLDVIRTSVTSLLIAGIKVKAYFIFGFPEETEADFKLTYELARFLKEESLRHKTAFRTSAFQFRPYHGTELYHQLRQKDGVNIDQVHTDVQQDRRLSDLVGRLQFNFHSGNYSLEPVEKVHEYIYLTTNLNADVYDPYLPRKSA